MARKRKNGDGMLRLRSDGRWEARLLIGYTDKGKAITKNVTAKDKDDCIKKFEELKEKYEASKKDEVSPHISPSPRYKLIKNQNQCFASSMYRYIHQ